MLSEGVVYERTYSFESIVFSVKTTTLNIEESSIIAYNIVILNPVPLHRQISIQWLRFHIDDRTVVLIGCNERLDTDHGCHLVVFKERRWQALIVCTWVGLSVVNQNIDCFWYWYVNQWRLLSVPITRESCVIVWSEINFNHVEIFLANLLSDVVKHILADVIRCSTTTYEDLRWSRSICFFIKRKPSLIIIKSIIFEFGKLS